MGFPGAVGIVFDVPWLCRRRRGIARSLSPGIDWCRQKMPPPSLPSANVFLARIPCADRDWFEFRRRLVRPNAVQRARLQREPGSLTTFAAIGFLDPGKGFQDATARVHRGARERGGVAGGCWKPADPHVSRPADAGTIGIFDPGLNARS
jgi:hypothetical protein